MDQQSKTKSRHSQISTGKNPGIHRSAQEKIQAFTDQHGKKKSHQSRFEISTGKQKSGLSPITFWDL